MKLINLDELKENLVGDLSKLDEKILSYHTPNSPNGNENLFLTNPLALNKARIRIQRFISDIEAYKEYCGMKSELPKDKVYVRHSINGLDIIPFSA